MRSAPPSDLFFRHWPLQDQTYRAVDFAFQGTQFVSDVLHLTQFAGPSAGWQLPRGVRRHTGSIGKRRDFFELGLE
jgi:hypothetical protein